MAFSWIHTSPTFTLNMLFRRVDSTLGLGVPTLHCCGINLVGSSGIITIATMLCQNIGIWTLIFFLVIQLLDLSHLSSPAHQNILMRAKTNPMVCAGRNGGSLQPKQPDPKCSLSHAMPCSPSSWTPSSPGWLARFFFVPSRSTSMDPHNNNHPSRSSRWP